MSKYLSFSGLKTLLSEVRKYVDYHATSMHSNVYVSYPVAPIDPVAPSPVTLGPTYNEYSVEMRVIDDESQRVYYPVTTIDSVLDGAGTELWHEKFSQNIHNRIDEISPQSETVLLSQKVINIRQWRYRYLPSDAQIITIVKALTGVSPTNKSPLDGTATLVLEAKNGKPVWYIEIYRKQTLMKYTISDEDGNTDFKCRPNVRINGAEFITDKLGLRPPGAFIAVQDSFINPNIPNEYFDDQVSFYRETEDEYERIQLISATSIIFFYSNPGNYEDYMIEHRRIALKSGNTNELDGSFNMTLRTEHAFSMNLGTIWCAQIIVDYAGIEYLRETV